MHSENIPNKTWGNFPGHLLFRKHEPKVISSSLTKPKANYTSFAFLMTFIYMVSFFARADHDMAIYNWLLLIKGIGTLLCVGLFLEYYWPAWLKRNASIYWHLTLLYCLPFAFTLFFLMNRYNIEWLISISLAITLLIVLVDWITFLLLSLLGVGLALLVYWMFIGPLPVLDIDNLLLLIYSTTFTIAIGLVFVRRKEQSLDTLLLHNQQITEAQQKYREELAESLRYREQILQELNPKEVAADPEETNHPLAIELEEQLMEKLKGTSVNIPIIEKALDIIKRYHEGVKRKSGEPFFTHPIAVALILLEYSQDQDAILGALLHDTVEDTSFSFAHIRMLFGETVEFLVAEATNLEDHKRRISLTDKENLARILNYEDPRAALVKLSDRLHNMRTIQYHSSLDKQKYIAQETLEHFVPLARKLGIEKMATELEKLSQAVLVKQG